MPHRLLFASFALAAACATSGPIAPLPPMQGFDPEPGIDRHGGDYSELGLASADKCADACLRDDECRAFTFVKASGLCRLKREITEPRPDACCVSGVK